MSDYIDTRDGWRKIENVRTKDLQPGDVIVSGPNGGGTIDVYAFWTVQRREEPVPPLPTEPYTVIRAVYDTTTDVITLQEDGRWHSAELGWYKPDTVLYDLRSFEVLSEPRAVTAKAVLDRVRGCLDEDSVLWESDGDAIAREFGVES